MNKDALTRATVEDPVCGKQVAPGIARSWDYLFEAKVYHFCGPDCRSRFAAGPKEILKGGPGQARIVPVPPPERDETDWLTNLLARIQDWWSRLF